MHGKLLEFLRVSSLDPENSHIRVLRTRMRKHE